MKFYHTIFIDIKITQPYHHLDSLYSKKPLIIPKINLNIKYKIPSEMSISGRRIGARIIKIMTANTIPYFATS